jgi:hypothetical protein
MLLLTILILVGLHDIILSVNYILNKKTDEHNIVVNLKKKYVLAAGGSGPKEFPCILGGKLSDLTS